MMRNSEHDCATAILGRSQASWSGDFHAPDAGHFEKFGYPASIPPLTSGGVSILSSDRTLLRQ
jgi:hypothetical protein